MEKAIGKRIQELRKQKGVTQDELSEAVGISPHYLSSLERGLHNIKLETLVKMLNYLDGSADEVFCDVVNKASAVKSNELYEKVKSLPVEEQRKIFDVVDTMIKNAKG